MSYEESEGCVGGVFFYEEHQNNQCSSKTIYKEKKESVCERERCAMKVLLYLLEVQDFYIRNIILCCCSCSCFAKSSRRLLLPGTFVATPSLSTK